MAMKEEIKTGTPNEIAWAAADPGRGVIRLIGECGGASLITGAITESSMVPGTFSVETEHGTLYLPSEETAEFIEADS